MAKSPKNEDFRGLDSGFPHLNSLLDGLDTGLVLLVAPSAVGKTTLAWQIACQVAEINHAQVIFVSMEQPEDTFRIKAVSRLSGLEYSQVLRGEYSIKDADQQKQLSAGLKQYGAIAPYLTVLEGDSATSCFMINDMAQQRMRANGTYQGLIVVDDVRSLALSNRNFTGNARDRVTFLGSSLQRLARNLKWPVIAIGAADRGDRASRGCGVVRNSGDVAYSANVVMMLDRDKESETYRDGEYRCMFLSIVKNRYGERGRIKFKFYPQMARFVEGDREPLSEEDEEKIDG